MRRIAACTRPILLTAVVAGICALVGTAMQSGGGSRGEGRSLIGRVFIGDDQPVQKAVVYLKNTKTLAVRSYITEPDGSYRFPALSPNVDYEIFAEFEGAHSDTKTLSAFDSRKQANITLRIHSGK